jgi:hypothetical protein
MTFFNLTDFKAKYPEYNDFNDSWKIDAACEKIYGQIGLAKRGNWDETSVPEAVKNASMEQLRFMLEYDIPFINYKGKVKAGEMESELINDISTLSLTILGNNGYLYRGAPINTNMSVGIHFDTN